MIPTVPRTRPSRVHVLSAALGGLMAVGAASGWYALAPRAEAHVATDASTSTTAAAPGAASYADLVQKVMPAVVTVRSERMVQQTSAPMDDDMFRRFFGDQMPEMPRQSPRRAGGLGSGVVVNADGYILTNNHVVEGAQKLRVEFSDGRTADAKLVGTDKPSDLAVLKVQLSDLPVVPIGNSDGARVGDVVFAVGNPLGIGQTVTMGIVSAKGRVTGSGDGSFEDFIQTDAPINQGNSGGALINTNGELIGINAQILSPVGYNIGIGFSIPSNMARRVMDQLIENGHVRRGEPRPRADGRRHRERGAAGKPRRKGRGPHGRRGAGAERRGHRLQQRAPQPGGPAWAGRLGEALDLARWREEGRGRHAGRAALGPGGVEHAGCAEGIHLRHVGPAADARTGA